MPNRSEAILPALLILLLSVATAAIAVTAGSSSVAWSVLCVGLFGLLAFLPFLVLNRSSVSFFFLCLFALLLPLSLSKGFRFNWGGTEIIEYLSLRDILAYLAIASWFLEQIKERANFSFLWTSFFIPFFLWMFWGLMSALNAPEPFLCFMSLLSSVKWLLLVLCLTATIRTPRRLKILTAFFLAGFFLQSCYVILQTHYQNIFEIQGQKATIEGRYLFFGTAAKQLMRSSGTLNHPNSLGSYLGLGIPLVFAFFLKKQSVWFRAAFGIMLASGLVALLYSFSRGGWLSVAFSMLAVMVAALSRHLIKTRTSIVLLLLSLLMGSVLFLTWKPLVWRIAKPDDYATKTRLALMEQSWAMVQKNPWLGVGLNNYARANRDYPPQQTELLYSIPKGYVVHNKFALVASETGWVGLLLYLWLAGTVLAAGWSNIRGGVFSLLPIAIGLFGSFSGTLVNMLFDHYADPDRNMMFWFVAGLILAMALHLRGPTPKEREAL